MTTRVKHLVGAAAVLIAVATAAACGGSNAANTSAPPSAAAVVREGNAALKSATAAGFDVKLQIVFSGRLAGVSGAAGALAQGPVTIEVRGNAGSGGRFDARFALNATGSSISGRLLSANGRTGYLQIPALMGPGWHSFAIPSTGRSAGGSAAGSISSLNPASWLTGAKVTSAAGLDTVSAALDVPRLLAAAASSGAAGSSASVEQAMSAYGRAVKVARGSISYSSSTHLPQQASGRISIVVPPKLIAGAGGLKGLDLSLSVTFTNWNQSFTVTAPSGATPLSTSGLLSGLGATG